MKAVVDRAVVGAGAAISLGGSGCKTLSLVGTDEGRPLYEKMGFEVQAEYAFYQIKSMMTAKNHRNRPATNSETEIIFDTDRAATGEERATFAASTTVPVDNIAAVKWHEEHGYDVHRRATRMVYGKPPLWNPHMVYSRIGGNLG